ncbi:MAG: flagellar basal body L-ring protein FlgH [Phycisphaerae bacterium]|nr:flagellar basal body L-ring protein FlgH [Gemmatimonadaceae bacterium]
MPSILVRNRYRSRLRMPALIHRAFAALVAIAAAALVSQPLNAQPPAAAPVTPPVGAPGAATTAATTPGTTGAPAQTSVALPPARESWYADRRNFAVGDIVTILIDDYTITTAVKENLSTDSRGRNLGLTARLPSSTSKSVGLQTNNDASQNQRGAAKRENRFQNEMSVRVVAVGANGLLQLRGTKNIDVDKAKQDIVLTGWVRAQDISLQNMVESARLADATIGYASPGNLAKPKQGIISKILGALWP